MTPMTPEEKDIDNMSLEAAIEYKVKQHIDAMGECFRNQDRIYRHFLDQCERAVLRQVYRRAGENQLQTAKVLGINRNTLRKKLVAHRLDARLTASR